MDSKDLDREMDTLLERLAKRPAVSSEPYSGDPLASDHFILARSWEFFKKRISAIEKQWQEIVNAKAEEIQVLKKELELGRNRVHELEEAHLSLEGMLVNFKMSRLEDFEEFKRKNEKLKMSWEEERVSLESKLMNLEYQLEQRSHKVQQEGQRWQAKLDLAHKSLESFRQQNQELEGKNVAAQQNLQKIILDKDDSLKTSETKIDLLRREVERRDEIIKALDEKLKAGDRQGESAKSEKNSLMEAIRQKEEQIKALVSQNEQFRTEKASLFENWQREKAEWRELWERAREVWEKKKP